jgi:hypothetical protein
MLGQSPLWNPPNRPKLEPICPPGAGCASDPPSGGERAEARRKACLTVLQRFGPFLGNGKMFSDDTLWLLTKKPLTLPKTLVFGTCRKEPVFRRHKPRLKHGWLLKV